MAATSMPVCTAQVGKANVRRRPAASTAGTTPPRDHRQPSQIGALRGFVRPSSDDICSVSLESKQAATTVLAGLGFGLGVLLGGPIPADAATPTEALEMQRIVKERTGAALPSLDSSPSVAAAPSKKQLSQSQLSDFQRELQYEREKREELEQKLMTGSGSRSIDAFRRDDRAAEEAARKEAARLKAEAEAEAQRILADAQQKAATAAANSSQSVVNRVPQAGAVSASTESSSGSLLNALGIVAAGALGGLWYLTKSEKDKEAAKFEERIAVEKGVVQQLREKSNAAKAASEEKEKLLEQLRNESAAAKETAARAMALEKEATKSALAEKKLVEKSLAAEQNLVDAISKERTAAEELLAAEKVAKYAAEQEALAISEELERTQGALENEKGVVSEMGNKAAKKEKELEALQKEKEEADAANKGLQGELGFALASLDEEHADNTELRASLAEAKGLADQRGEQIEQIREQTLTLKTAMTELKNEAATMAQRAKQLALEASADRAEADKVAEALRKDLDRERTNSSALDTELKQVKDNLASSQQEVSKLKGELQEAKAAAVQLEGQVSELQEQVVQAEEKIAAEKEAGRLLQEQAEELRGELSALQGELASTNRKLKEEKERNVLQGDEAMEALKLKVTESMDQFEAEQDKSKKMTTELNALKKELTAIQSEKQKADGLVDDLSDRILDAEEMAKRYAEELEMERVVREDATNAVMKLQEVIMGVKDEMEAATQAANFARVELGEEQMARAQAEDILSEMRAQMESMQATAEQKASEAQTVMLGFRNEMENMKNRSSKALSTVEAKRADVQKLRAQVAALKASRRSSKEQEEQV